MLLLVSADALVGSGVQGNGLEEMAPHVTKVWNENSIVVALKPFQTSPPQDSLGESM